MHWCCDLQQLSHRNAGCHVRDQIEAGGRPSLPGGVLLKFEFVRRLGSERSCGT
jgi:hypothetical protein